MLDHILALVCGLPPDSHLFTEAETVWPRTFSEIELVSPTTPSVATRANNIAGQRKLPRGDHRKFISSESFASV